MIQLNLTAYGESTEEVLFHVVNLVRQLHAGRPAGRTDALRPDRRGRDVLTNMGRYGLREAGVVSLPTAPGGPAAGRDDLPLAPAHAAPPAAGRHLPAPMR